MELDEFINKTLTGIAKGISAANKYFIMEPHQREKAQGYISFDVAVTISNETSKSGGAGIKIAVVDVGGEMKNVGSQESISRIKFHILPQLKISEDS